VNICKSMCSITQFNRFKKYKLQKIYGIKLLIKIPQKQIHTIILVKSRLRVEYDIDSFWHELLLAWAVIDMSCICLSCYCWVVIDVSCYWWVVIAWVVIAESLLGDTEKTCFLHYQERTLTSFLDRKGLMGWVCLSFCLSVCHASTAACVKPYVQ
jgi:hypothetical protein